MEKLATDARESPGSASGAAGNEGQVLPGRAPTRCGAQLPGRAWPMGRRAASAQSGPWNHGSPRR